MITSIQGTLTAATPLHAIVELNGFGYEVNVPVTTAEKLPQLGATVKLHTKLSDIWLAGTARSFTPFVPPTMVAM